MAATARATLVGDAALATGACAGLLTGLAGFAVMPFERIGTPLANDLRLVLLAILAVPAIALALAGHASTIALATAAVVLVAATTTRGGSPARADRSRHRMALASRS